MSSATEASSRRRCSKAEVHSVRPSRPVGRRGAGLTVLKVDHERAQEIADAAVTRAAAAGDGAHAAHGDVVVVTAARSAALRSLCQRWLAPSPPLAIDGTPRRRPVAKSEGSIPTDSDARYPEPSAQARPDA